MKADLDALDPWRWRWLYLAAALFLADQGSKWVVVNELVYGERIQVLPYFAWVRWHNAGAAFSFLADAGGWQRWFFVVLGFGFCAYVVRELSRLTLAEALDGLGLRAHSRRGLR
jgi:signal peptidase II